MYLKDNHTDKTNFSPSLCICIAILTGSMLFSVSFYSVCYIFMDRHSSPMKAERNQLAKAYRYAELENYML